jgi:parvulin-like peptidyl-prolyl isomerase
MKNILKFSLLSCLISNSLFAKDINIDEKELIFYTQYQHKVDFQAQTPKSKQELLAEYAKIVKLSSVVSDEMKNDMELNVALKMLTNEIWAKKYLANIHPSDEELKKLYKAEAPKTVNKFKLRNILISSQNTDKIIDTINKLPKNENKLEKFIELVKKESLDKLTKDKDGLIGVLEENTLEPNIKKLLTNKKTGELIKLEIDKNNSQVIYIEEFIPARDATFDEAKEVLTSLFKQQALNKKIDEIMNKEVK